MEIMPYGSADTKLKSLMVPHFVCSIKEPVNHIKKCSRMDALCCKAAFSCESSTVCENTSVKRMPLISSPHKTFNVAGS